MSWLKTASASSRNNDHINLKFILKIDYRFSVQLLFGFVEKGEWIRKK